MTITTSGLYIVRLSNEHLISVNAQDARIAKRCRYVNFENCKVGKAVNLLAREKNYFRTFGESFVTFEAIALTEEIKRAERTVLFALHSWRVQSPLGRRTEWLAGIEPQDAAYLALAALRVARIPFEIPLKNACPVPGMIRKLASNSGK